MALLFLDSFDTYASADVVTKWSSAGSITSSGIQIVTAPTGLTGNSLRIGTNQGGSSWLNLGGIPASGASFVCGFQMVVDSVPGASQRICSIRSGTSYHISLYLNNSGQLLVYRGDITTLLGTASGVLAFGSTAYYIEFKGTLATGATGSYEVRVNGVSVLSQSSVQTSTVGTTWDSFLFGYKTATAANTYFYHDNFYLLDGAGGVNNDFWGPVQIKAILPNGAGNYTQMTRGGTDSGANWSQVDEASQNADTDYVSETTVGEKDTYALGAVGLTGTVKGVQTNIIARSDGAGGETVAGIWRISTTDYTATAQAVGTTYADIRAVYDVSPATASAWTIAEIDGAEFGPKLVS